MANIEVFILNYNGNSFLGDCLSSLSMINKGNNSVVVNVIDNKSPFSPREILVNFPKVNYIPLDFNGGFSTGNNLGVSTRLKQLKDLNLPEPDYIVFLNNDTRVEKEWLNEAVKTLELNPTIGILGSKSVFMDQFVKITFKNKTPIEFKVISSENIQEFRRFKFNGTPRRNNIYTVQNNNEMFIPIVDDSKDASLLACISNDSSDDIELSCSINDCNSTLCKISKHSSSNIHFRFIPKDFKRVIQNAGSYITNDWMGGDIGFLKFDNGQFDKTVECQAICGVSMFIRTKLFKKLHGFDQKYFAYFEDTDLSLRARLAGYHCIYEPKSKLQHLHCGSSTEYSEYFNLNVNWSYFLFINRYASLIFWLKILIRYLRSAHQEFKQFQHDNTLNGKYNLRTIGRCIKSPFYFFKNRVINLFINTLKLQEIRKIND